MKIEINLKDLILFSLVLFALLFSVITFIGLQKEIEFAQRVNQVNMNTTNIQLLDNAIGQIQKQIAPTFELQPQKK